MSYTTTTDPARARMIGQLAAQTITDAGLTVGQAAEHLGVTVHDMAAKLAGHSPFDAGELPRLKKLTGRPVHVLVIRREVQR